MDSDFRDGGAFFLYGNGFPRKYRMNPKTDLLRSGSEARRYVAGEGAVNQIPARRLMYTGSSKLVES